MSVNNLPHLMLYLYDEETGEKGSDEVISCIHHYVQNKLPTTVEELDIWTDGCAGQCWNNYVAAFFEMLLDKHSPLHEKTTNLVHITLWRNPRGHTYMETDSQGGQLAHKGRLLLNNINTQGAIHVVMPHHEDPHFTVSWYQLAKETGLNIVLPDLAMFKCWGDFLLDSKPSPYKKPDRQDCYHSPNRGDWLITRCHQINFGVGENENGLAVKHNGVWFC